MDDNEQLTAEEQAALDAQRGAPEPEAPEPAADAPETALDGAGGGEAPEGGQPPAQVEKRPGDPAAALVQERERRREVERQSAEDRRRYEARLEEVLKLVPQPAAQPETPAPAIPDVQADPVGHIVGTMQQLGASQAQINQRLAEYQQSQQAIQIAAAVRSHAAAHEEVFRKDASDYDDALNYLKRVYDTQLQVTGVSDPGQRRLAVENEAIRQSVMALQQGANIAERFYRLAEASGYRPAGEQASNGQATPAQSAVSAAPDEAARLQMVQRGQEHARGLGNVRGNGPSPMTAAKLLDMDDDAFLEAMKKSKDARKLMGA